MTFSTALSNALSGMDAATMAIRVRSHNIANAGTEGYAARDLALRPGPTGGVRTLGLTRAGDPLVEADRLLADARAADASVKADAAEQITALFGEPGDADGLYDRLAVFGNALDDLAASPESVSVQRQTLSAAQDLVTGFNRIGEGVTEMRTRADREIASTVRDVNTALRSLQDLNAAADRGEGGDLSDLAEAQDRQIDIIAEALPVRVSRTNSGAVRLTSDSGVLLLGERARQIDFTAGGIVAPGNTIASGHLSGLSVEGIDLTPNGGPQGIRSGALFGQFAVRDDIAPEFGDRVDAFAASVAERFSRASTDPTLVPGQEGLFVSGGSAPGVSSRLRINDAVDPAAGGDLFRLRDGIGAAVAGPPAGLGVIAGLREALRAPEALPAVTGGPSAYGVQDTAAELSSLIGTRRVDLGARAAAANTTANSLRDDELIAEGVNTDQELQSLLLIEQAYAANARVVQVVSDMMARLMEI